MRGIRQYAACLLMIMMGMVAAGCRHHNCIDDMQKGDCLLVITIPSSDYAPYSETRSTTSTKRRIKIRLESEGKVMDYHTITDKDMVEMNLKLEYRSYRAYVWCDEDVSEKINTDNLPYAGIPPSDRYSGLSHASAACVDFDMTASYMRIPMELRCPFAKIRFIATDTVDGGNSGMTASVSYKGFLPSMLNVATFTPCDAAIGYGFSNPITSEIIVEDHIFAGEEESFVRVDITVKDQSERIVAATSNIKVPYRRGHVTTVIGDFLTPKPQGGGGITIDTEWSGEYEIEF